VHRAALRELVNLLETEPDAAIAGSTMMQLDYPWRINEMGAFVKLHSGELVLHRNLENIAAWEGKDVYELLKSDADLCRQLLHCQPFLDVDYVAAASLLIRADVAKQAGLWRDYFIHFDDVEWCLRVGEMGHRVLASAKSLIWHLSAAAKVPTWVLYYDSRNILDMMKIHHAGDASLKRTERHILLKAVYYHLLGKTDLAGLLQQGLEDYQAGRIGKKEFKLTHTRKPNNNFHEVLANPNIQRIIVSCTVNLQGAGMQKTLVQALRNRPELEITFMASSAEADINQLPRARILKISPHRIKRWWQYWNLRGHFDAVIQSDYAPLIGLSWLNASIAFINDEGFCEYPAPQLPAVWQAGMRWVRSYFDNV
jgi:GT2 family glycosyltransferase